MAVAAFWDVGELKLNVFMCLREDICDADLARCARVHRTWTNLTLNALWFGYPRTSCEDNRTRARAIAGLPTDLRQGYASRVGVLDFTDYGGSSVHAKFEGLNFPRLKEVILHNIDKEARQKFREFQLSRYLQPTLQSLKLLDQTYDNVENGTNWLTASFLTDVARRCPDLKQISFWVPNTPIEPSDHTSFFRSIKPQEVSLDLPRMLTCDLLSALSHDGGCLESLAIVDEEDNHRRIKPA
ncbi:unnamed protein product [Aureobasidium vineae]|uniref:F-box domain-containing protein n=1 Tax=Aureobasidium vineae TaxID=2773715 RepID=A0A9N8JDB0_9PEZI|nr:unnamed protein product [Aureobasidium vineae]